MKLQERKTTELFDLVKIGKACKKLRLREGYSIVEFANLTGYNEANIRKFENGKNNNLTLFLYYLEFSITGLESLKSEPEQEKENGELL